MEMKTKTNEVLLHFNYDAIDERFDFYQIKTSDKYISKGARILDLPELGAPVFSMSFECGTSAFAMFKKGKTQVSQLRSIIQDEKISVRKVEPNDMKTIILARLLLNSLNHYKSEALAFNNLTGKLFVIMPQKNTKTIPALQITLYETMDGGMRLDTGATAFLRTDTIKNKKSIQGYPLYQSTTNHTLRRVLSEEDANNRTYVHKAIPNTKTRIAFLNLQEKTQKDSKCYVIYKILDLFNSQYEGMASICFKERTIERKITAKKDKDFFGSVLVALNGKHIHLVNFTQPPDDVTFDNLCHQISNLLSYSDLSIGQEIQNDALNIVMIHNQDYYKKNEIPDPYKQFKRNQVIQCVTVEDAACQCDEIIFKTILKELAIKNDLIHERQITLDDWGMFRFSKKWIFGISEEDRSYFIEVYPDGKFKTIQPTGVFDSFKTEEYRQLNDILMSAKGKGKTLIADDHGNINLISCSGITPLPEPDIFNEPKKRTNESIAKNLVGITGINLYKEGDRCSYNCGYFSSGLNSSLPTGSLIYDSWVVEGQSIIPEVLQTMSVLFVKWNSYTVLPYPVKYLREWVEDRKNAES